MLVGFFMILVDATIVAVANPSIMDKLGASYDAVIWVTSAYLLAYAVPLLVAGRLGDRFGPKNLYLLGLTVFTAASLWCGLAGSIEMLIAARVVQGIGAALLTPQTLSTITRIFPADRRGVAMSVWGATAGVATLVGPLAGGVLVDRLGWQWIFFVNVPVGIIGLALAVWLIPVLPTQKHRFDLLGVLLSGVGMFLIVFALQEGQSHHWAPWIWGTLAGGIGFMAAFLVWQSVNRNEPLIPLVIFRDRDFSLSNVGVATIGFVVTAMFLPLMFYAQAVCGLSPTRSALLTAPMAIATGVLAPFVGKIVDRSHPRPVIGFGFSVLAIAMTWLSIEMTPTTPIWRLVLPLTAMGIGIGVHLGAAGRDRHPQPAAAAGRRRLGRLQRHPAGGLGARQRGHGGVHDVADQRGDAADADGGARGEGSVTRLPAFLHEPFAAAMSQSLLLPAFFALFGVVAAMFLLGFGDCRPARRGRRPDDDLRTRTATPATRSSTAATRRSSTTTSTSSTRCRGTTTRTGDPGRAGRHASLSCRPTTGGTPLASWGPHPPEGQGDVTEPMRSRADHLLHAPAEYLARSSRAFLPEDEVEEPALVALSARAEPREAWRWRHSQGAPPARMGSGTFSTSRSSDIPPVKPKVEPIGFAHNGFHVDEERFQPLPPPAPEEARPSRHRAVCAPLPIRRRNRRNGRSGSSPTVGIPVTTPTTHRATAGTRCRAATDSARAGSREQTQNPRHAGVLAHFACFQHA